MQYQFIFFCAPVCTQPNHSSLLNKPVRDVWDILNHMELQSGWRYFRGPMVPNYIKVLLFSK